MKKLFKALIALCCALCISLGVISCSEIKGKSKIQKVTITLSVNGEKQDFNFELYLNYAEGTIQHFTDLAKNNYYDGTAVSNLNGHIEFGSYYLANGALKSKYDADATKAYSSIITAEYMKGKTLYYGKDKDEASKYPRYNQDGSIIGEFALNGYTGNELGFNGALVLKRDINLEEGEAANAYDTGKATMAVTFGNDGYFTSSSEFAIIGMVCSDDEDANGDSSYERLKALMTDYSKDSSSNVYYYYTLGTDEYYDSLTEDSEVNGFEMPNYGHYFMYDAEEGSYFYKNQDGVYVELSASEDEKIVEDPYDVLMEEWEENEVYLNTLPYGNVEIKVEKIVFAD